MKAKGQVRLRSRKLKRGGASLYLDIYHKGLRRYEYLRLYLREERTPMDRQQNSETMRVAEAMRARRMIELQRRAADLPMPSERTVGSLVREWVEKRREKTAGTYEVWSCWERQLTPFRGLDTSLKDLDKEWWVAYVKWVRSLDLKESTQRHYLTRMRCILNKGERDGLIAAAPCKGERIATAPKAERVWLTVEEIRLLKEHSQGDRIRESAFLFGCVTGLRYSDIQALKWEDIRGRKMALRIRKTHRIEYMDLSGQALEIIGAPGSGPVFPGLSKRSKHENYYLQKWAKAAGIGKHISFHTSRHTFAVLMLSAGVDIYTLSRLLGHHSVTTTQIYADIVDARKAEAVEMMPIL